jgi:predicted metal-dependent peptidase
MSKDHDAYARLEGARCSLVLEQPFFASLAMGMKYKASKSVSCIATDGATVHYNPDAIMKMSAAQVLTAVARVTLHPALGHLHRVEEIRRAGGQAGRGNVACSFVANAILERSRFSMDGVVCHHPSVADASMEEVYHRLPPGTGENAPGECDSIMPPDPDLSENEATERFVRAFHSAVAQGKVPDEVRRLINELLPAQVNWRAEIHQFVQEIFGEDYSFSRPNRRHLSRGFYLPSLQPQTGIRHIVFGNDTSGSRGQEQLEQCAGEIDSVRSIYPCRLTVIHCDCGQITKRHVQEFEPDEPLLLRPVGGGSTDFSPVFDWVERNLDAPPDCLIYHTDMMGYFPEKAPDYPVLWVSDSGITDAPFGRVIVV